MSFLVTPIIGCWGTVQTFDPLTESKYEGFILDGKTTKKEVTDRLGTAHSAYENGKILIYNVYLKDGRMTLEAKYENVDCHALVLLFDENNVLKHHRIVRYGCENSRP